MKIIKTIGMLLIASLLFASCVLVHQKDEPITLEEKKPIYGVGRGLVINNSPPGTGIKLSSPISIDSCIILMNIAYRDGYFEGARMGISGTKYMLNGATIEQTTKYVMDIYKVDSIWYDFDLLLKYRR